MHWAYSVIAVQETPGEIIARHAVGVLPAISKDEALGKAMRIARKTFPTNDGWRHHHVLVHDVDVCVDVEETRLLLEDDEDV